MIFILSFYLGACLSSFTYCTACSFKEKRFAWVSHSRCDHCYHVLSFWQLFPLFSYILLGRRCYFCKHLITADHFFIELFGGLCSLFFFSHHRFSFYSLLLFLLLLFMASFDFSSLYVPDTLQFFLLLTGLLYNDYFAIIPLWFFFIFLSVTLLLILFEQLWIGGADLKFICLSLLFIPISEMPLFLLIASLSAILYFTFTKQRTIPFIPFLVLALCIIS